MRISTYTKFVELDGERTLLLNLPRRVADIVPRVHATALRKLSSDLSPSLKRYAARVGYITTLTANEERGWFRELVQTIADEKAEDSVITLGLVTTNSCNLSCSYCFQSDTGMRQLDQRIMTRTQVAEAFAAVDELVANGKELHHVELFGGEPLMPSTRPAVEHAVLEAEARAVSVRATTNGVFLEHFADLISATRMNDLQISLDGSQEFHDSRRVSPIKRPTFSRILQNICSIADSGARIEIRSNVDKRNIDGIIPLLDILDDCGLLANKNITYKFVNVQPDESSVDYISGRSDFMSFGEVQRYLVDRAGRHSGVIDAHSSPLSEYLTEMMQNPVVRYCGAGTSNLFFSPESKVYTCDEHVGRPDMAVANPIRSEVKLLPLWSAWSDRRIDKLENCVDCPISLAHGGGCGSKTEPGSLARFGNCGDFPSQFDERIRSLASG